MASASAVIPQPECNPAVHVCTAQVVSVDIWIIRDRALGDRRVVYHQPPGVDQDFVLCRTSSSS